MAEMTHFERLGLPQRFAIDSAALERNYLAHEPGRPPRSYRQRPRQPRAVGRAQ